MGCEDPRTDCELHVVRAGDFGVVASVAQRGFLHRLETRGAADAHDGGGEAFLWPVVIDGTRDPEVKGPVEIEAL